MVVTRYAHGLPTEHIRVIEAGHPVPDEAGEQAAADILARCRRWARRPADRAGLRRRVEPAVVAGRRHSMADLKATTRELLRCGAPITDMNIVRKHTSRIQGGRLAQASRAPVTTLIVSDVAGDDPSAIASGPTVPDASTYADALAILKRYGAAVPATVQAHLERGARGEIEETPKPGDPLFMNVDNRMIATAHDSLEAAAAEFRRQGVNAVCSAIP
jgi:hydroxypyruvate reductase